MLITVAFFLLRYSGFLPPRSSVPHLPSWCVHRFFLLGPTLWIAHPNLVLVQFFLNIFSFAMPLRYGGTPSCQWQPTFSRMHSLFGSVSLASCGNLQQHSALVLLPQSSDRFYCDTFLGDLLMFCLGLRICVKSVVFFASHLACISFRQASSLAARELTYVSIISIMCSWQTLISCCISSLSVFLLASIMETREYIYLSIASFILPSSLSWQLFYWPSFVPGWPKDVLSSVASTFLYNSVVTV
jgi:hypothetical protein